MDQLGVHVIASGAVYNGTVGASGIAQLVRDDLDLLADDRQRLEVVAVDLRTTDQAKHNNKPPTSFRRATELP